ncbi:Allantoate deiminase [Nymphaea thermarum]|nr:Allantoate deiminase [Nymphaea thermarum]
MAAPLPRRTSVHSSQRKILPSGFTLPWLVVVLSLVGGAFLALPLQVQSNEVDGEELITEILREESVHRLQQLGEVTDGNGYLERTFLSPASFRALDLVRDWMQDAGLTTWIDQIGNLHGRTEGNNITAPTLIIGSHLDTVIDAGKYDGSLGIICAISALKALKASGRLSELRRRIEIIAFCDEEGVRFQSTFLGSAAISGSLPPEILEVSDKSGRTVQDALKEAQFEGSVESLLQLKYDPQSVGGYVEVHIEQGPVLESLGLPLGVVQGIAGQTRLRVTVKGVQGHAGTVPMFMRQDPMAAAAELILLVEDLCKHPQSYIARGRQYHPSANEATTGMLVCTVGQISSWPSSSNVIPGQVTFSVDIRAVDDTEREAIIHELGERLQKTCERRHVSCSLERKHDAEAVHCDPELNSKLKYAVQSAMKSMGVVQVNDVPLLVSGAGHDAIAMSRLTKVGMLFVRCRGGISHSPVEFVIEDDVWAAGLALLKFLQDMV